MIYVLHLSLVHPYYGSLNDVPLKIGPEKIEVPSLSKTLKNWMLFSHIPTCYKKFIAERKRKTDK